MRVFLTKYRQGQNSEISPDDMEAEFFGISKYIEDEDDEWAAYAVPSSASSIDDNFDNRLFHRSDSVSSCFSFDDGIDGRLFVYDDRIYLRPDFDDGFVDHSFVHDGSSDAFVSRITRPDRSDCSRYYGYRLRRDAERRCKENIRQIV